jgi:hypothetical protein
VARPVSGIGGSDPRLLRLADEDTVLIVIATIAAGERFVVEGETVETPVTLPIGFKVAAGDLAEGSVALRYGTPIGRLTRSVRRGQLVHTHNLESLYMRTHARGEA